MTQPSRQFDVAVIGAGAIGCAVAWRLGQAGLRVAVVERGAVGREASHAAGGMLAPLAEAARADEFFELAVASRAMYADFARELRDVTGVDVEYRTEGTLYLALSGEDEEELERRWQWQRAAGLSVRRLSADDALRLEPQANPRLRWALHFPEDHQVDNRRLMTALDAAARGAGAEFWTHAEVRSVLTEGGTDQGRAKRVAGLRTTRGELRARCVIVAAGSWAGLLTAEDGRTLAPFQLEPVRGQMIMLEMPAPPLRHVIYSGRGYVIPRLSGVALAGSTTERVGYDKRVTAGGMASIIERAAEIVPRLAEAAVVETWAGLRPASSDDWPIIGEDPRVGGLIYATGHYRNGILLTPITARAVAELVTRGESCVNLTPFSPSRFSRPRAA
jgi:glycine oxidase